MLPFAYIISLILITLVISHNYRINKSTFFLGGYLAIIIIYFLLHYALFSYDSAFLIAILYKHFYPVFYLPGAMIYLYIRKNLTNEPALRKIDLVHLIPFMIAVVNISPYFLVPFSEKLSYAHEIIEKTDFSRFNSFQLIYPFKVSAIFRLILFFGYVLLNTIILIKHWKKNSEKKPSPSNQNLFKWLTFLNLSAMIFIISLYVLTEKYYFDLEIEKSEINSNPFTILAGLTLFLIPFVLIFFPQVVYGVPISILYQSKQSNTSSQSDPTIELASRITHYFETERPYQNINFSLDDLSKALNTPKHLIYKTFNTVLKIKFTELRTSYRVEHAKKMLKNQNSASLSLKEIWTNSGFSSKTNFFTTFKEETGFTPTEYFKNHQK